MEGYTGGMDTMGMPPDQLLAVLRHIGPGLRNRWVRRKDVLSVIGRLEEGVELSAREMERRGLFSRGWACRVLRELGELEVLLPVWTAAGPRAGGWMVNPNVLDWREVPWLTDPRIVRDEVNHPASSAAPNLRPVSRSHRVYRDAVRSSVAVLPPSPRHKDGPASRFSGKTATQGFASVALNRRKARRWAEGGQSSSLLDVDGDSLAAGSPGSPAAGSSASFDESTARLQAYARKKLGLPFLAGRPVAQLAELAQRYGVDQVLDALAEYAEPASSRTKRPQLRILDLVEHVTIAVVLAGDERLANLGPIDAPEPDPPAQGRGAALPPVWEPAGVDEDEGDRLTIDQVRDLVRQARSGPAPDPAAAVG